MDPLEKTVWLDRREFFTSLASGGLGMLALQCLSAEELQRQGGNQELGRQMAAAPLAPRPPHFSPRARRCIFIFLDGGPSQMDLFDPKPKLEALHGQTLPASLLENVRFAFINKNATLKASPRTFRQYGECGMHFSDLLPELSSCADQLCMIRSVVTSEFNHHPAQLVMQCGQSKLGLPAMGSWLLYGLGSEFENLPGYIVLSAGRGTSGGATLWDNGFLNSVYGGVLFRTRGDAVLNLENPAGIPRHLRRLGLDALRELNEDHYRRVHDPEILGRVANYELAFRMQADAVGINDLSDETAATLDAYGVHRTDASIPVKRDGGPGQFRDFSTNCLMARRLIERGVRFVNIFHGFWDHHEDVDGELPFYTQMVDQPITALIRDLKLRGLLDETLVVIGSEFGRTPLGQDKAGRDHHPYAFTMLLTGGGIRRGYVHGETDEIGWAPVRDPVHVSDLHATLLHLFGLDHTRLTYPTQGLDQRLTTVTRESRVITELLA